MRRTRTLRNMAASCVLALAGSFLVVMGGAAAQAAPALTAAPEPFQAPLCAGEISADPRETFATPADLSRVFGQRLTDYQAGRMVVLYNTAGSNAGDVPICGVRNIEGVGAVSEWMYCTDMEANTCAQTDSEGRLTHLGQTIVEGLQDFASNPMLDADQERLIRYILTTEIPVQNGPVQMLASDQDEISRDMRQRAVWCVTEARDDLPGFIQTFCDANFSAAQQQAILDALPEDPVFEPTFAASSNGVTFEAGDTVEIEVSTSIYETPITVQAPGATVGVCPASAAHAALANGQLTVNASTAPSQTVRLCLAWATPGTHAVDFAVTPAGTTTQALSWVQSPTLIAGKPCQVYANFDSVAGRTLTAGLSVAIAEAAGPGNPTDPGDSGSPTVPGDPSGPADPDASTDPGERTETGAPVTSGERTLATTGGGSLLAVGALAIVLAAAGGRSSG